MACVARLNTTVQAAMKPVRHAVPTVPHLHDLVGDESQPGLSGFGVKSVALRQVDPGEVLPGSVRVEIPMSSAGATERIRKVNDPSSRCGPVSRSVGARAAGGSGTTDCSVLRGAVRVVVKP